MDEVMDPKKIQALKDLGITQDVIDALLADVMRTEKSAIADHVRYKGAAQSRELEIADVLNDAIGAIEDRVWLEYEHGRFRSALDMTSALVARTKAAPDPVAAAGEQFIAALRAKLGDEQLLAWLDQQTRALDGSASSAGVTLTDSGRQSAQVATKSQPRDVFATIAQGDLRSDRRPRG